MNPYDGLWIPTQSIANIPRQAVAFSNGAMSIRYTHRELGEGRLLIHVSGRNASMVITNPFIDESMRVSTFVGRVNATKDSSGTITRFSITFARPSGLHFYYNQQVGRTLMEGGVQENLVFERVPLPGLQVGPDCGTTCALARSVGLPDNSAVLPSAEVETFSRDFFRTNAR